MDGPKAQKVILFSEPGPRHGGPEDRLNSWKEIAAHLKRGTRTVQRWSRDEALPVYRLQHDKLGSVYAYRSELDAWWVKRGAEPETGLDSEPANRSIAVLPFVDMSQERDQEYFCDGIAEEIINALSRVKGLRVASRTASFQFRGGRADSRDIGRRLRVKTLLEGSVRKAGGKVRVAVQLTDAESRFQVWAARYDRALTDIFAIQEEIGRGIVEEMECTLGPSETSSFHTPSTADIQAYDCYLKGRNFYYRYSPRDVRFALEMFSQAAAIDPGFAQAYAGLADCWSYLYLNAERSDEIRRKAEWASTKAVEMDPDSAQAQASHGLSLSLSGQDEEAERAFAEAIRLDPGLYEAHYFHARHCFSHGQLEEAVQSYEKAIEACPAGFQSPLLVAQSYEALGRTEEAAAARRSGVEAAERHLRLNPDDARAVYMAANGLAGLGEFDQARNWAARARQMAPEDSMALYNLGCIYSMIGDIEDAIECLEGAAQRGLTHRGWYENDSNLDRLRRHPRFIALLAKLA